MFLLKQRYWRIVVTCLLLAVATSAMAEMGRRSNICGSWNNNCSAPTPPSTSPSPPPPGKTPPPPRDDGGIQASKDEVKFRERQARLAFVAGRWEEAVKHARICTGNDLQHRYCSFVAAAASYYWDLERYGIADYTGLNIERLEYHIYDYEWALRLDPNNPDIYGVLQGLKRTLAQRKADIEANDPYTQNRKAFQQASDYYNAKDYKNAAKYYREAIKWDPNDVEAYQWLGWSLFDSGPTEELMDAFRKAIALGLKDAAVFRRMMYLTFDNKKDNESLSEEVARLETALGYARELQFLKPNDLYARKTEAEILIELGRRYDADKAYQRALEIEPKNEYTLEAALKNSFENHEYDQASVYVDRLEAVCQRCSAVSEFKNKIAEKKLSHQFLAKYKESEASPEMVDHYFSFGDSEGITTASKDIERYTADLKRARTFLATHPDDAKAYEAESLALSGLWRHTEALASMEQAIALSPKNAEMVMKVMDYSEGTKDYQKAMLYADRADQLKSGNPEIGEWIERLINNELIDIRYGGEERKFDLAPDSMRADFRSRVLKKSLDIVRENLKWEPEDPKLLALQTELVAAQTALEQAKETAVHSQAAARARSIEQIKEESMIGFDTASMPSNPQPVQAIESKDPVVSETSRTEAINIFEQKRAELRSKKQSLEKTLADQQHADKPDTVAISNLKQSISSLENNIHFLNFSIEEELRKANSMHSRDTLNTSTQASQQATDSPDVTEMSVGGEALTPQDQAISEQQLAEKRKIWEADTRTAVRKYIERKEYYSAIERKTLARIASDPQLKQAVETSDRLWKEAENEYERRLSDPEYQAREKEAKLLVDAMFGVRYWPGEQNPEAPLPNPLEEEAKRFKAVSDIYGKLKERQPLLNIFERMADEMEAEGY